MRITVQCHAACQLLSTLQQSCNVENKALFNNSSNPHCMHVNTTFAPLPQCSNKQQASMPDQLCLDKVCLHRRMKMQQYLEFILVVSSQNKAAEKAVV